MLGCRAAAAWAAWAAGCTRPRWQGRSAFGAPSLTCLRSQQGADWLCRLLLRNRRGARLTAPPLLLSQRTASRRESPLALPPGGRGRNRSAVISGQLATAA